MGLDKIEATFEFDLCTNYPGKLSDRQASCTGCDPEYEIVILGPLST